MNGRKSFKISLLSFCLFIAIILIFIMAYYIYTEKLNSSNKIANLEDDKANMQNTINELQVKIDSISNIIDSNKTNNLSETKNNLENTEINNSTNITKELLYTFTSADRAAANGYPRILKIFKLSDSEIEFDYNSGFDFINNTIDRQILGTAKINNNNLYEFEEITDGHKYKLLFEFDESKETVKIYDFDNENELGWINLYR